MLFFLVSDFGIPEMTVEENKMFWVTVENAPPGEINILLIGDTFFLPTSNGKDLIFVVDAIKPGRYKVRLVTIKEDKVTREIIQIIYVVRRTNLLRASHQGWPFLL